jgi:hypothetical protein
MYVPSKTKIAGDEDISEKILWQEAECAEE